MRKDIDPTEPRQQPPVARYAAIIAIVVIIGVVLAITVGRSTQNPRPAGVASSPAAAASMGPTPRY